MRRLTGLVLSALVISALAPAAARAQSQTDLFDDTQLQEVRLVVNSRDWAELRALADENTYYPATLVWKNVTVRNVGIRSRGNGTRNGIKPGLRIDFNRYLTNQTFLGMKALVLDNAYSDPSTIRESVSMKLFARMGLPAPREAHARLYVNNEYAGVYVIVEEIDRTFITRLWGPRKATPRRAASSSNTSGCTTGTSTISVRATRPTRRCSGHRRAIRTR